MTEKIRTELDQIHTNATELGRFALNMLEDSIDAFEQGDSVRAAEIVERKAELKRRFIAMEESMFQSLAMYQPVARDMRLIVTSIRLIYNFERIGRMGYDIAETITVISRCSGLIDPRDLITMGRMVIAMISDALDAFERRDASQIMTMRERDREVDSLYCDIIADLINRMKEDKTTVPVLTRYVIIDRYLERCGDQACNIAEMTVYMITGERVEIQ